MPTNSYRIAKCAHKHWNTSVAERKSFGMSITELSKFYEEQVGGVQMLKQKNPHMRLVKCNIDMPDARKLLAAFPHRNLRKKGKGQERREERGEP
jgi:hypothetical protein